MSEESRRVWAAITKKQVLRRDDGLRMGMVKVAKVY